MDKKWYKVSFSAEMSEDDKRAMNKCFYDAMEESMQISPCANLKIQEENGCENCGCIPAEEPYCAEMSHCPQCGLQPLTPERQKELFDNMVNHISELVSGSDLRSTLHCIGFTNQEIALLDIDCNDYNECPLGGDITNDCEDCPESGDYHYCDGECVLREEK